MYNIWNQYEMMQMELRKQETDPAHLPPNGATLWTERMVDYWLERRIYMVEINSEGKVTKIRDCYWSVPIENEFVIGEDGKQKQIQIQTGQPVWILEGKAAAEEAARIKKQNQPGVLHQLVQLLN
jgi:hypothetical protein